MTVWLLNFSLDWDVLDLSAIKGVGGFEDLSYGLDPLMLYLPEGQRIRMSGMDEFELTSENVLFGSDKARGGRSGKVELDLSSLSSSLSPLASPQVVGALGMMLFFLALTCICSRLESPNLKEMKVKADKRRAWRREEERKDDSESRGIVNMEGSEGSKASSSSSWNSVGDSSDDEFMRTLLVVHSGDSDDDFSSIPVPDRSASNSPSSSFHSSNSSSSSSPSNHFSQESSQSSSASSHSFHSF
jgi:hypothetical protein